MLSKSHVRVLQVHAAKPGLKQGQAFVCAFSTTDFLHLTILEGKLPSPCTPTLALEMRNMNEQYLLPCFSCGSKGATMTVSETCESSLQSSGHAGCRIHCEQMQPWQVRIRDLKMTLRVQAAFAPESRLYLRPSRALDATRIQKLFIQARQDEMHVLRQGP